MMGSPAPASNLTAPFTGGAGNGGGVSVPSGTGSLNGGSTATSSSAPLQVTTNAAGSIFASSKEVLLGFGMASLVAAYMVLAV